MAAAREIIVYVRAAAHPATASIAPGAGIVGEPRGREVLISYEGAVGGQVGRGSLADRVRRAYGRMRAGHPTRAAVVPREAVVVVGTFHSREGRIILTGPLSEGKVAAWLGAEELDLAELACDRG